MGYTTIACESWQDFRVRATSELFLKEPFERGVFLFRGHGRPEWPLISTFDRWYGQVHEQEKSGPQSAY